MTVPKTIKIRGLWPRTHRNNNLSHIGNLQVNCNYFLDIYMFRSSEDKGSVVPIKQNSVCYTKYFRSFILFHKLAVLAHLLQEYCVFSICPADNNIIHQHPFSTSQLWFQFNKTFKTCLNPREAENKSSYDAQIQS